MIKSAECLHDGFLGEGILKVVALTHVEEFIHVEELVRSLAELCNDLVNFLLRGVLPDSAPEGTKFRVGNVPKKALTNI